MVQVRAERVIVTLFLIIIGIDLLLWVVSFCVGFFLDLPSFAADIDVIRLLVVLTGLKVIYFAILKWK